MSVLAFEDGKALRPGLEKAGVPIHIHPYYFRWSASRRLRSLTALAARLRFRIRPDALLPFVGIHSKAMAQVWPYSGAKFCWWNQQDEGRDLHGTKVEKEILGKVSCVTSNSEAGRAFLTKIYGLPADQVLVYNNGTPLPDLGIPWTDVHEDNRPMVSMVANIIRFKDHETLIDAWALVRKRYPQEASPVLMLAGHMREKGTSESLMVRAFKAGLSAGDVRFLGPVADVMPLIRSSELVVHSSLTEGCPNAVCEAMSYVKPVVATDIPGCRQALGDANGRWLVPPKDAATLAERIYELLENPGLREQIGAANRRRIEQEFSISGMNRFFQDLIEKGLGCKLDGAPTSSNDHPLTEACPTAGFPS